MDSIIEQTLINLVENNIRSQHRKLVKKRLFDEIIQAITDNNTNQLQFSKTENEFTKPIIVTYILQSQIEIEMYTINVCNSIRNLVKDGYFTQSMFYWNEDGKKCRKLTPTKKFSDKYIDIFVALLIL